MLRILLALVTLTNSVWGSCRTTRNEFERSILYDINRLRRFHENTPDLCFGESDETHTYTVRSHLAWMILPGNYRDAMNRSPNREVGELLYWQCFMWGNPALLYKRAVELWYDDGERYDYEEGRYSRIGLLEDTFAQLVGSRTKEVNCGNIDNGSSGHYLFCQVWPETLDYEETIHPLKDPDTVRPFFVLEYVASNATLQELIRQHDAGVQQSTEDTTYHWKVGQNSFSSILHKVTIRRKN